MIFNREFFSKNLWGANKQKIQVGVHTDLKKKKNEEEEEEEAPWWRRDREIYEHSEIDEKHGEHLGGLFETLWSNLFKIKGMTKCMSNTVREEIDLQNRKSWKAIGSHNWGMVWLC